MPDTFELNKEAADNLSPEQVQQFNQEFLAAIEAAPNGILKNASASSSQMIRRKIRENGYFRSILPPKPVTNSDLDRALEHELPRIIEDMEPDSPGAKACSFGSAPETFIYRGRRFEIIFFKIESKELTKSIDELRTTRMDLRQVVTDNTLKEIQTTEDGVMTKTVDRFIGSVGGVGASGSAQNVEISGGITRVTYKSIVNHLQDLNLNNGVFLLNRHTATEFLGWGRDELGGDLAERMATGGLRAMEKFMFFGVPHIATIKRDLVPDNVIYQFTEPDYLGRFYTLEEVTMFVERRKDIIRQSAHEKIGFTFANVAGAFRTKFTG